MYGELLRQNLGDHGLGAVAPERCVELSKDLARGIDPYRNAFGCAGERETRRLQRIEGPPLCRTVDGAFLACRNADADISALLASFGLFGFPTIITCELKRLGEHRPIISAVVDVSCWHDIRKLVRKDQVLAAQLDGIETELICRR